MWIYIHARQSWVIVAILIVIVFTVLFQTFNPVIVQSLLNCFVKTTLSSICCVQHVARVTKLCMMKWCTIWSVPCNNLCLQNIISAVLNTADIDDVLRYVVYWGLFATPLGTKSLRIHSMLINSWLKCFLPELYFLLRIDPL